MTTDKNRRSFLQGAALAGAAVAAPLTATAAAKKAADSLQRAEFPMPDFDSIAGDTVSITTVEGIVAKGVIEEVKDLPVDSPLDARPGYVRHCAKVVRFKVAGADQFNNELHQVKHSKLGKMDLLLSAVPDADGNYGLEAIFN
ncbi:MAG: hypothetical protein AAF431_00965 [Pseudomonadota bacterium]